MYKVTENNGKVYIKLQDIKRIEKSNANELESFIGGYFKQNCQVLLDINNVFYIDTDGFKILLSLKLKAEQLGGRMYLIQLKGALLELFNVIGLSENFEWLPVDISSDPALST